MNLWSVQVTSGVDGLGDHVMLVIAHDSASKKLVDYFSDCGYRLYMFRRTEFGA